MMGLAVALAGCEEDPNRLPFDGFYFKSKTSKFKDGLDEFTVTVFEATRSLDGARQAAGFEGTRYCIANYGTSKIVWAVGPQTALDALSVSDDQVVFSGRCNP
ncbi:MAG: hypothetical protein AB8B51_05610 [Sedimentitalea sp.]